MIERPGKTIDSIYRGSLSGREYGADYVVYSDKSIGKIYIDYLRSGSRPKLEFPTKSYVIAKMAGATSDIALFYDGHLEVLGGRDYIPLTQLEEYGAPGTTDFSIYGDNRICSVNNAKLKCSDSVLDRSSEVFNYIMNKSIKDVSVGYMPLYVP